MRKKQRYLQTWTSEQQQRILSEESSQKPTRGIWNIVKGGIWNIVKKKTKPFKPGKYLYKQNIDYSILYAPALNYYFPVL